MAEKMKSISLDKIKGATDNGIQWMIACGAHNEAEARELAARCVENIKLMREQIKLG